MKPKCYFFKMDLPIWQYAVNLLSTPHASNDSADVNLAAVHWAKLRKPCLSNDGMENKLGL